MAIMLPPMLAEALNYLGFNWPISNEDVLDEWADEFSALASDARSSKAGIEDAVAHVASHNSGVATEAFLSAMRSSESNVAHLESFADACDIASGASRTSRWIVITLKGVFIFQLGVLAASLASGPGALVVREVVRRAVNAGIGVAADQILEEVL